MDGAQPGFETPPAIGWFHSLTLPGGETTAGEKPAAVLAAEADVVFKHGVAGKRVLDIGAWEVGIAGCVLFPLAALVSGLFPNPWKSPLFA